MTRLEECDLYRDMQREREAVGIDGDERAGGRTQPGYAFATTEHAAIPDLSDAFVRNATAVVDQLPPHTFDTE